MKRMSASHRREIVLVGAGHSHVQTLRRLAMDPIDGAQITLIVDTPIAVYSGMVPGFVAGQYKAEELAIDALPLARRAGARIVFAPAVGIDPKAKQVYVEGRPPVAYDWVSFDIGSTVAGLELPGVRQYALPTRPIGQLVSRLDRSMFERSLEGPLVVVGAGAGGVELVFALEHRFRVAGHRPQRVVLVHGGEEILPGYSNGVIQRIRRNAHKHGIEIECGRAVEAVEPSQIHFRGGASAPAELVVWVAGAVSQPLFRDSGLEVDDRGFLRVRNTLQSLDHDELFAVGDCATLDAYPKTPKAGVYAVRQGPFITDNLRAIYAGRELEEYRPQSDFLTLLNLGDGTAIGSKWGRSFEGRWVMRLKDRIDRRFMERFQVLRADGALTPAFADEPEMGEAPEVDDDPATGEAMFCGGCAAKLGQTSLERVLGRVAEEAPGSPDERLVLGLDRPDDAVAYTLDSGEIITSTIDSFRAFTDDPFSVGRIAARNATSDLFAKGSQPLYALASVQLPQNESEATREETLFQVLAGAREVFTEEGLSLAGGHTTIGGDLVVGFAIQGHQAGEPLLAADQLRAGQHLILTQALGTGVLFNADMHGLARGPWIAEALTEMNRSSRQAAELARRFGVSAATDITGFGLAGHLGELLAASQLGAELWLDALPLLPGATELLERGERSTFHSENRKQRAQIETAVGNVDGEARFEILFDPQTGGGLLLGCPAETSDQLTAALHDAGYVEARRIGTAVPVAVDAAPTIRLLERPSHAPG